MTLCKSGQISNCCHPNALMTLKEYLVDYASAETKAAGEALIARELLHIPNPVVRQKAAAYIAQIEGGERETGYTLDFLAGATAASLLC